jgi:NTP pyrophosphatase (non-canonical NTP hydrolase)|tara:strand:+ start:1117 stop:1503 length:387 start_codon:yes stop_codon:yes gene_type:complete
MVKKWVRITRSVLIKVLPLCTDKMSLNFYKDETEKVCKSKGWDRAAVDTVWLLLTEEFGELASAIRQYKKTYKKIGLKKERGTDVMMEMGDVFSYLFQLAHMLNVDLDMMWEEHKNKMKTKKYYLNYK